MAKAVKVVKKATEKKVTLTDGTVIMNKNPNINLKEVLYNSWRELLTTGKVSSKLQMAKLLEKNFKAMAAGNADPEFALKSLREIRTVIGSTENYFNNANTVDKEFSEYMIHKQLLNWQKEVFNDRRSQINLLAGRRAGKSYGAAAIMINHCLEGTDVSFTDKGNKVEKARCALYIGLTIQKAKEIMWGPLIYFIDTIRMPVAKIDKSALRITFQNGAYIQLAGNSNKNEREKVRGTEWSLIAIDECQSQDSLRYLLVDILGPIIKGRNSTVLTMGTAPLAPKSYWEEVCQSPAWAHYNASLLDNETIPNRHEVLEKVLSENNWTRDNVIFRREYLGEIAYDTNLQVFPVREYYDDVPVDFRPDFAVVGVDYGFQDSNAFVSVIGNSVAKRMYVVDEKKFNHSDVTTIVATAKQIHADLRTKYNLLADDIRFYADCSDQSISREIWNYGIQIENANKSDKHFQFSRLNELMRRGILLIKKGGIVDEECSRTMYQHDKETDSVIYEIDNKNFHPDAIPALQYAISGLSNSTFFDELFASNVSLLIDEEKENAPNLFNN